MALQLSHTLFQTNIFPHIDLISAACPSWKLCKQTLSQGFWRSQVATDEEDKSKLKPTIPGQLMAHHYMDFKVCSYTDMIGTNSILECFVHSILMIL